MGVFKNQAEKDAAYAHFSGGILLYAFFPPFWIRGFLMCAGLGVCLLPALVVGHFFGTALFFAGLVIGLILFWLYLHNILGLNLFDLMCAVPGFAIFCLLVYFLGSLLLPGSVQSFIGGIWTKVKDLLSFI